MQKHKSRAPPISLPDAMLDEHLFARWFPAKADWTAWTAFLAALFALPMTAEQRAIYRKHTGRKEPPTRPVAECWICVGRRAGKSFVLALISVWLACFNDYRKFLAPGERGVVLIICPDRKQARVILRYVRALLTQVPMLAKLITRETAESFDLHNGITIEVGTASFRTVRGYTIVCALCDEIAFFPTDDSVTPDVEIIAAIRPGMATIPNAMLLCASSPYARRGALWDAHRKHYGVEGDDVLVWQADTRAMHPSLPQRIIDEAYENDPANAAAEYGAQFRTDVEGFLTREAILNCVSRGIRERLFVPGTRYQAFVDPSGGSADAFTIAIGHKAGATAVVDVIREIKPPFSPESVVADFALLLKTYEINRVVGDRYAGLWPREQFQKYGITYDASAKPKSDLYRDFLPLVNSKAVDFLDSATLASQLSTLERRTARGGRDTIDHSPSAHDDVANVVAGLCTGLATKTQSYDTTLSWVGDGNTSSLWGYAHQSQFNMGRSRLR